MSHSSRPGNERPAGEIFLRAASTGDNDFLLRVYTSTRQEEMAAWGWTPARQSDFITMQFGVRQRGYAAAYPSAETCVISFGEAQAGSIITSRARNEIRLVDIALLPEFRGCGVGGEVIRGLVSEAGESGSVLRLSVLRGNRAEHLYERLGFIATGGDAVYCEMELTPRQAQERADAANTSRENVSNAGKAE